MRTTRAAALLCLALAVPAARAEEGTMFTFGAADAPTSAATVATSFGPAYLATEFPESAPGMLSNTRLWFFPTEAGDDYTYCASPASGFATVPDTLAPSFVGFQGGGGWLFYGEVHNILIMRLDGSAVIGTSDTTPDVSYGLDDHYAIRRISGLFQDFAWSGERVIAARSTGDPANGLYRGTDVLGNAHEFQIEIFPEGLIRITYLAMGPMVGVIGLSDGGGLDPGFVPTDFTAPAPCPPMPPLAYGLLLTPDQDTTVHVPLGGDDEAGKPLRREIVSLPRFGQIVDPSLGLPILTAPHMLAADVDAVDYVPPAGWYGDDRFEFRVTDGGTAPDGGWSDVATVDVEVQEVVDLLGEALVDDADPGWTADGAWAFGPPQGNSGDPTSAFSGANVYGYGLSAPFTFLPAPVYLTSPPFDVAGWTGLHVSYRRWLTLGTGDIGTFEASTDGTTWTTVAQNVGVFDGFWHDRLLDLSFADGATELTLRWGMGPTTVLDHWGGWNLDDIRLISRTSPDCDPANPTVNLPPSEVANLRLDGGATTTLTWQDQTLRSGSGTVHELVSGDLALGPDDAGAVCLQSTSAASHVDARIPPPGEGYFYLVRARNDCGGSSFGDAARDAAFPDVDEDGASDVCE